MSELGNINKLNVKYHGQMVGSLMMSPDNDTADVSQNGIQCADTE